jgi:hypothetical protein
LVRLVLQHGRLLRQLQSATAALQHEAQLCEEVPTAKEAACYKYKEEIDKISQEIQVTLAGIGVWEISCCASCGSMAEE